MSPNLQQKLARIVEFNKHRVIARHIHFSFICKRNRIIAYGYNKVYQTHPISAKFKTRFNDIHSELSAISRFPYPPRELREYDFINIRLRRDNGEYGLSRPCVRCLEMFREFGINEIYYSNELGGFSYERIH